MKRPRASDLDSFGAVLDVEDMMVIFGLSRSSAYDYARRDAFPVPRILVGRRTYFSKVALLRLLQGDAATAVQEVRDITSETEAAAGRRPKQDGR